MNLDDLLDEGRVLIEALRRRGDHDAAHLVDALVDRCVALREQRSIRTGQLERCQARLHDAHDELEALQRERRLGVYDLTRRA